MYSYKGGNMQTTYKMKGYTLHLIPTDKFKTTTISLRLQNQLTRETTTIRTLLTFVMISATKDLPSTQLLASELDYNYGARLSTNVNTKGKSQIINVYSSFVNDLFLVDKENLLEKQLKIISDLFYNPHLINDVFDEKIVELKKKELLERLQSVKDDKFSYSLDKLFEYMGRDTVLGISSTGYEEDIADITAKDLTDYLKKCINEDEKHLYIVGDINEDVVSMIDKYIQFPEHDYRYDSSYIFNTDRKDLLEVIEKQDITQSKLNIGYTINCDFNHKNHYAMTVFNMIFGGYSQSRLFKVVREEHSLCYYVSSSYDAFNGILIVNAGIENKDYDKTLSLIKTQLEDLINGHISEEEISLAKAMLTNSLRKTNDEANSMITLAYNRDITGKIETNEDYINKLNSVTKQQLIEAASQVKLDSIYFLTGKENYESN